MKIQLLKTFFLLCFCMALAQLGSAKDRSVVVKRSKTGNMLIKVYSPGSKKYTYKAKDKNGRRLNCGPIKPGTTTQIPTNCEILCDKDFHGKDVCFLVCPAAKTQ
jgi:hypothetical protein